MGQLPVCSSYGGDSVEQWGTGCSWDVVTGVTQSKNKAFWFFK